MAGGKTFRLSNRARADIRGIWAFTAERWSLAQAESYIADLDRVFTLLADFPDLGAMRPEIRPPVRVHRFKAHLVVYRDDPDGVEVVRVLHMRQDRMALLEE